MLLVWAAHAQEDPTIRLVEQFLASEQPFRGIDQPMWAQVVRDGPLPAWLDASVFYEQLEDRAPKHPFVDGWASGLREADVATCHAHPSACSLEGLLRGRDPRKTEPVLLVQLRTVGDELEIEWAIGVHDVDRHDRWRTRTGGEVAAEVVPQPRVTPRRAGVSPWVFVGAGGAALVAGAVTIGETAAMAEDQPERLGYAGEPWTGLTWANGAGWVVGLGGLGLIGWGVRGYVVTASPTAITLSGEF